jgi:metallo-beta-lactamase class B
MKKHRAIEKTITIICLILSVGLRNLSAGQPIDSLDKNIGISRLTENTWLIQTSFACNGKLDCNHLLVVDGNEMVLVNTPASDSLTGILLDVLEKKFNKKVTKVIVSHFHDDSSAGLPETKRRGIISYSLDKTGELLKPFNRTVDIIFTDSLIIPLQTMNIELYFPGAGHSIDNIVVWLPSDKILFGGCLLKPMGATNKGNTADANEEAWPVTVQKVKDKFGDAKVVIPGHGAIGDNAIFDNTLCIVK